MHCGHVVCAIVKINNIKQYSAYARTIWPAYIAFKIRSVLFGALALSSTTWFDRSFLLFHCCCFVSIFYWQPKHVFAIDSL